MNAKPENQSPPPQSSAPEPAETAIPETRPEPEVLEFPFSNRHTGTVGRRPKAVRDRINMMLLDGVPYARIIEEKEAQCPKSGDGGEMTNDQ